jgi:hypothetical protein
MAVVAATLAGLGSPTTDGERGIVRVGTGAERVEEHLTWNLAQQVWVGDEKTSLAFKNDLGMVCNSAAATTTYISQIQNGSIDYDYSFQIHPVINAKALYDAGLRLQENLTGAIQAQTLGGNFVVLNWYPWDIGDGIFAPVPNDQGLRLYAAEDGVTPRRVATGWRNSPVPAPSKKSWYPDLYGQCVVGGNFTVFELCAKHRWVGGPGMGSTSTGNVTETPDALPRTTVAAASWGELYVGRYVADAVPVADGAAVADWADLSGRHNVLVQATSSMRPIKVNNVVNGHAVLRFDGVDDYLVATATSNGPTASYVAPATVMMVLRPTAGGATTQVWWGDRALFYHNDTTDLLQLWGGGTDLVVHATPWASGGFRVYTFEINGASSTIYENLTLLGSSNPGTDGVSAFSVGARSTGILPAAIDVAEIAVYAKVLTSGERVAAITALKTKYGIA